MPVIKSWKPEEDKILRFLYEEQKMKKWSLIAQRMANQFKMKGRTGKQCKQRYQEFFEQEAEDLLQRSWKLEQQKRIHELHNQYGNKWAMIASKMGTGNDNSVKNHFYSKLRKSLRKINKIVSQYSSKSFKKIGESIIYKIVEATDQRFSSNPGISGEMIKLSLDLKTQLYNFVVPQYGLQNDQVKKLFQNLCYFNLTYRRKSKKQRRSIVQSQNLRVIPILERQNFDQEMQSQSLQICEEQSIMMKYTDEQMGKQNTQNFIPSLELKHSQAKKLSQIDNILYNAGILENQQINKAGVTHPDPNFLKNSYKMDLANSYEIFKNQIIVEFYEEVGESMNLFGSI